MRYLILLVLFFGCAVFASAQKNAIADAAAKYSLKQAEADILEEEEDVKALILKYSAAPAASKPAVKKDIEKKELAREEELIEKQKQRIKRQEEQIKLLKQKLEQREKNKKQTVKNRVTYLISEESVEKIKNESETKKVLDKVKNKTKAKKK